MFEKKNLLLIISQENTCTGVSLLIKLQVEDWNFIKRDFNTDLLLCIYRNFWFELVDILLLLLLVDAKAVFTLSAAIFQDVCLRFT